MVVQASGFPVAVTAEKGAGAVSAGFASWAAVMVMVNVVRPWAVDIEHIVAVRPGAFSALFREHFFSEFWA